MLPGQCQQKRKRIKNQMVREILDFTSRLKFAPILIENVLATLFYALIAQMYLDFIVQIGVYFMQ